MKRQTTKCPECGAEMQSASGGRSLCARCLFQLGLGLGDGPLDVGDRVGHYEILEPLGSGGMGHVYAARDTKLNRDVAFKVFSRSVSRDPASLVRFRREAQALAALKHPNVVTVYSVEESEGFHYISMELVEGVTLDSLADTGGLDLSRFIQLSVELTNAVAAAHEQGIIHRDIKPTNLMLDSDGVIKVLDFGLAKSWTPGPAEISMGTATDDGLLIGTVPYMSPEQLEGKELDARSDVFSLGVVLYEMATGTHPFERDTTVGTMSSILRDEPSSLRDTREELPAQLEQVVGRCLEKEPDRRYSSAADLAQDLEKIQHQAKAFGEPDDAPAWAGLLNWDRFWPVAAAALLVILSIAVIFQRSRAPETGATSEAGVELAELDAEPTAPPDQPGATRSEPRATEEGAPSAAPGDRDTGPVGDPERESDTRAAPEQPEAQPEAGTRDSAAESGAMGPINTPASPFTVEAALYRSSREGNVRLASGSKVKPGDRLFMTFRASRPLHVYVLNEDDLGEIFVLFPLQAVDLTNPIEARATHRLPGPRAGEHLSWLVSSAGGEEHLLVIASPSPLEELENLLQLVPEAQESNVTYVQVPDPVIAQLRGIGGLAADPTANTTPGSDPLFSLVQNLVDGAESSRGVWIRRIDLKNPV